MNFKGYSIVSVLISLLIITVVFTSSLTLFNHSILVKKNLEIRYDMARAGQSIIEEFKSKLYSGYCVEDMQFTPYSHKYIAYVTFEPVENEELLLIINCLITRFQDDSNMGIYRIVYLNPYIQDDFYYTEFPITPE